MTVFEVHVFTFWDGRDNPNSLEKKLTLSHQYNIEANSEKEARQYAESLFMESIRALQPRSYLYPNDIHHVPKDWKP